MPYTGKKQPIPPRYPNEFAVKKESSRLFSMGDFWRASNDKMADAMTTKIKNKIFHT